MSITDPLIGKHLGDYLIEGLLGAGGMAKVYRGYDDNLDRYAAIKVIEPQLIASTEEDEYRERFLREARAIARLDHPNIVSVYQFNQIGNLYYIAMGYVEGRNLRDVLKSYIKQDKLMPTAEMLVVLRDIANALDYAHKQSIIHRDIKPSNILVKEDGHAILTDFGLALNAVEGTIGNTFGSVHYIAPEQAISSAQSVPQSDQYSLGIVTYELLTGRVPFDDASAMSVALKHISDPPPPPTELNPNIPPEVEQVVLKSLDKDTEKRYATSLDFINALELAFSMVDNQDIEPAPNSLPSGPPPATVPLPPPERNEAVAETDADDSARAMPESTGRKSQMPVRATEPLSQRTLMIGGLLAIVVVVIVGGFLFRNNAIANAEGTATAETATQEMLVQMVQATDDAAQTQTSEAQTAIAIDAQTATVEFVQTQTASAEQTSNAQTENAQASQTADALTLQETESAAATETQMALPTATPSPSPTLTPTDTPAISPTPTSTPRPTRTPTPDLFIGEATATDSRRVLLRYDGRVLIVSNRDEVNGIDVSDLVFVLFEPDDNDEMRATETFDLREGFGPTTNNVRQGRCFQVLDNREFRSLPTENPLAEDLCDGNPFWVATSSVFWTSASQRAYFEVRLGPVDVLTTCPVNAPLTRRELRCAFDLMFP